MTHEHYEYSPAFREDGGPERDASLPDATTIPEYDDVEQSLAPPMIDVSGAEQRPGTEIIGAEPGWWDRPETATQVPRWAGTEPNEV